MKKTLLLLSLTLLVANSFAQKKIDGSFSAHDANNWYSMRFYSDSLFTHASWSCKGGGISKGTYKIKKKILTVTYERTDTLKDFNTSKIDCDKAVFNDFRFKSQKGETKTYHIDKCNGGKLALTEIGPEKRQIMLFRDN